MFCIILSLYANTIFGQLLDTNAYNIWLQGYENPLEKEEVKINKVKTVKTYYTDKKGNKKLDYTLNFNQFGNPVSFYKSYKTTKRQVFYNFEFFYDSSAKLKQVKEYYVDPDTVLRNTFYYYNHLGKLASQKQCEKWTYAVKKKSYSLYDTVEVKLVYINDSVEYILRNHNENGIIETDTITTKPYKTECYKEFFDSLGNSVVSIYYHGWHSVCDNETTESVFVNHYNKLNQLVKREVFTDSGNQEIRWEYLPNGLVKARNSKYFFEYEFY